MKNNVKNTMKNNGLHKILTNMVVTTATAITMATILSTTLLTTTAMAQTASNSAKTGGAWGVKNPLFDKVAGKLNLTANVGYVYNFDSKWDSEIGTGKANGGFGYGARIGWTNTSGFGLSGDYLGFTSKWSNGGMEYTNPYHVLTITPSYRFSFGQSKEWGLKLGLGVGMSLADVTWGTAKTAKGASGKVAGGAIYSIATGQTATPADFGLTAVLTGNCAVTDINTNFGGIIFSDSRGVGASSLTLGGSTGSINRCNTLSNTNHVAGFTDAQIATALKTGKIAIFEATTTTVAYDVWKDVLGASATVAGVNTLLAGSSTAFQAGTAVEMDTTIWSALTFAQQTQLRTTLGFVTNGITAVNPAIATCTNARGTWNAATSTCTPDPAIATCTSGGGTWNAATFTCTPKAADAPSSGGSAKDDAGFVLAPEIALEYDNGLLHADINARYIHGLANVKYDGQNGTGNQLQKSGPLAVFIGAGFGVNF